MTTITEDYVSFETAKLLKEKGFPQEYDIYHSMVYNEEDYEDEYEVQRMMLETRLIKAGTLSSYPVGVPEPKCYCCTLQMAMKWLREVHNLYIDIRFNINNSLYSFQIYSVGISGARAFTKYRIKSYEAACEEAILYCLKNSI